MEYSLLTVELYATERPSQPTIDCTEHSVLVEKNSTPNIDCNLFILMFLIYSKITMITAQH